MVFFYFHFAIGPMFYMFSTKIWGGVYLITIRYVDCIDHERFIRLIDYLINGQRAVSHLSAGRALLKVVCEQIYE